MVFTLRCYWPRRTDDSYQDIVAAGANGLGPSALPQPTTTLSCSVLTAKFFPPTSQTKCGAAFEASPYIN